MDKKTILVVDDTPENIDLLVGLLKDKFIVKAARSGEVALKIARAKPPDLILLDIIMPGLDGYQVCRLLKAEEKTADIPVVFVSGEIDSEDVEKAEQFAAKTLVKPVDPKTLIAMLDDLL